METMTHATYATPVQYKQLNAPLLVTCLAWLALQHSPYLCKLTLYPGNDACVSMLSAGSFPLIMA